MTIDLASGLRRIKPERRRARLHPRPAHTLAGVADIAGAGRAAFVLDTNVYIRAAAGTLPAEVRALVGSGLLYHCSICIAELAVGVANADPAHPGWEELRDHYRGVIDRIPDTRLLSPDAHVWTEAGLIAGTLARTQNYQRHQRKECLNDALIFLTAAKAGMPVLTANVAEFDLIQQLAPAGRFVYF